MKTDSKNWCSRWWVSRSTQLSLGLLPSCQQFIKRVVELNLFFFITDWTWAELPPTSFTVHPDKSPGTQALKSFWRQGKAGSIVWTWTRWTAILHNKWIRYLFVFSKNLLVFYHECRCLIGHATHYLSCSRYWIAWQCVVVDNQPASLRFRRVCEEDLAKARDMSKFWTTLGLFALDFYAC